MSLRAQDMTAFVLAGGQSTRMGAEKALLQLDGRPLLAHALALARTVAQQVKVVGDPKKFAAFADVVEDVYVDRGPLGGIHAAMRSSKTDHNLILGVDMPFLDEPFLKFLSAEAQSGDAIVTVPSVAGHFQNLCAVYRKPFLLVAERALHEGRNRLDRLFAGLAVRVIDELEITRAGFHVSMFRNLNTPEDLESALRELERPGHLS